MKKICSTVSIYRVDSFHQSKIAFSGIKNVENFHTLRRTLTRWFHESPEIALSGCQNAENLLTRSLVPLIHGFHDSAKIAFSRLQKAENKVRRLGVPETVSFNTRKKIAFSGPQNDGNLLDRRVSVNRPSSSRPYTI